MKRRDFIVSTSSAIALGFLTRSSLFGQAAQPATPVATGFRALRRGVGIFTGRGGTVGWLANRDALVMVDTQFADTAAKFMADLPGRDGRRFDAVLNTHHHWDHTGGNATVRPEAKLLVAHEAVPALQKAAAARNPQMGAPTLPDTLFADAWRLEAGDEIISARHFGAAHTGGDIIVHFERANVVHLGDLVFNRLYPVTDRPGGCRVRQWIRVLETAAHTYPADAIFIFGHGKPQFGLTGTTAEVLGMRDYLTALAEHVQAEIKAGKTRAEIITRQNLDGFPDYHASQNSRLPANLGAVYDELTE